RWRMYWGWPWVEPGYKNGEEAEQNLGRKVPGGSCQADPASCRGAWGRYQQLPPARSPPRACPAELSEPFGEEVPRRGQPMTDAVSPAGLHALGEYIESVLTSAYVEDGHTLSGIVISSPDAGKSERLMEYAHSPGIQVLNDATAYG